MELLASLLRDVGANKAIVVVVGRAAFALVDLLVLVDLLSVVCRGIDLHLEPVWLFRCLLLLGCSRTTSSEITKHSLF